jgi:hypothetical protein
MAVMAAIKQLSLLVLVLSTYPDIQSFYDALLRLAPVRSCLHRQQTANKKMAENPTAQTISSSVEL